MSELANKKCVPCTVGTPPLKGEELHNFFNQLEEGWELKNESALEKTYKFKDFSRALAFVNALGKTAEEEQHHPDIFLAWGKVVVTLSTHKIKGLSESDFIIADKCDAIFTSHEG